MVLSSKLMGILAPRRRLPRCSCRAHEGKIVPLPALPSAWPNGRCKGLRARGAVEVDLSWRNGQLVSAELRPEKTGDYKVRFPTGEMVLHLEEGKTYPFLFQTE